MRVKEITASLSATIGTGSYENLKPNYSMTIELLEGESEDSAFEMAREKLRTMIDLEANRAKVDLIEKQYQNIRFYEIKGKKYPGVTSILGWDKDWKITEDELSQYGARGTIVHKLIELYLKDKKWYNPVDLPELEKEVNTLCSGSLNLTWNNCSYKEALENIINDLELVASEKTVINEEHLYAGRFDLLAKYKGELSIVDFKTGSGDMRQLAAYGVCLGVKSIVIVPVGPNENKSGFKKPIVSTDIEKEFKSFLRARNAFRQRFGI